MADVLEQLRDAAGGDAREATQSDAVGGMPPRWVVRPASTEQTSAVLAAAAQHGLTVVARGAGTKLRWGAPPEQVDVVLDTTRMDAIVEHAAGDLICVVGAGRTLASLQQELGRAGQRLGIDSPRSGTVGGAVATATTGPTRLHHGAVRDLVIGMTLVRADGVVAHSGGKVVKNVAGYDLGKLLTGSFGTLGVITQVAFRLHPVPAARRWVSTTVPAPGGIRDDARGASGRGGPAEVQRLVLALTHSQVVPSAVELDWSAEQATLSVLLEGAAPGVEGRTAQTRELLGADSTDSAEARISERKLAVTRPNRIYVRAANRDTVRRIDAAARSSPAVPAVRALARDFLTWLAGGPRTYSEVMAAWQTSCPRLSIWEDALADGLVRPERGDAAAAGQVVVTLTARGRAVLDGVD